jgi:predicted metal-dependent hydrolase
MSADADAALPFDYTVRRSDRARRVRVRVDPRDGAVEVVASRAPGTVPYLGATLTLAPQAGRTRVTRLGHVLLVPAEEVAARGALERWYRRQARIEIGPRLDAAAAAVGRSYTTLTIRDQRTRWGSCSSTGAMSFNWRLLLAPEAVLEYVVRHEAAHLAVMDHSPRFWAVMGRLMPGYERPRRWLRDHGATLVL